MLQLGRRSIDAVVLRVERKRSHLHSHHRARVYVYRRRVSIIYHRCGQLVHVAAAQVLEGDGHLRQLYGVAGEHGTHTVGFAIRHIEYVAHIALVAVVLHNNAFIAAVESHRLAVDIYSLQDTGLDRGANALRILGRLGLEPELREIPFVAVEGVCAGGDSSTPLVAIHIAAVGGEGELGRGTQRGEIEGEVLLAAVHAVGDHRHVVLGLGLQVVERV